MQGSDHGEHRIVYACDDDAVAILLVGKSTDPDVYKQLKRLG